MIACPETGSFNDKLADYAAHRALARKWASYALQNRREGLPWRECARLAHEHLSWALPIIRCR